MKPLILTLALLAIAAPAHSAVIHDDAPRLTSPDGKLQVQFLVGPNGTVGKNLAVNRLEVAPGGAVPEHVHENSDEIVVLVSGQGQFTLDGKTEAVKAGDTVFVPRGHKHAFAVVGTERATILQVYEPAGPEDRFKAWNKRPAP